MANRMKAKGTYRESWWRDLLQAAGVPARRWEAGAPGRDVDADVDRLRIFEVKDRQNLNVHKTLAETIKRWPHYPAAVVWHRTSKKEGNTRLSPDGPTIVAFPAEDAADIFRVMRAATALARITAGATQDLRDVTAAAEALREAVAVIDAKYPPLDEGGN